MLPLTILGYIAEHIPEQVSWILSELLECGHTGHPHDVPTQGTELN